MDYLIFIFVTSILLIASISDFRKREVPDSLSYILIAGSLFLSFLYSIAYNTISNLVYMPVSILVLFGFAYFMYRSGQWGGGDVKLIFGLSTVFTSLNMFSNRSFIALFINVLLFGGVYGIFATIFIGLVKIKKLKEHFKYYDLPFFLLMISTIVLSILFLPIPLNFFIALAAFMLFSMRLIFLVANNLMYVTEKISKLTEGDWLVESPKDERGKNIVPARNTGLTLADIEKLKNSAAKTVQIKIGLPFVPGILIAVIITILFGNPLLQILSSLYI